MGLEPHTDISYWHFHDDPTDTMTSLKFLFTVNAISKIEVTYTTAGSTVLGNTVDPTVPNLSLPNPTTEIDGVVVGYSAFGILFVTFVRSDGNFTVGDTENQYYLYGVDSFSVPIGYRLSGFFGSHTSSVIQQIGFAFTPVAATRLFPILLLTKRCQHEVLTVKLQHNALAEDRILSMNEN